MFQWLLGGFQCFRSGSQILYHTTKAFLEFFRVFFSFVSLGFFGGQILGSGESPSKQPKSCTKIRDVGGEKKTEEGEKPFVHILFFSQGGEKEHKILEEKN